MRELAFDGYGRYPYGTPSPSTPEVPDPFPYAGSGGVLPQPSSDFRGKKPVGARVSRNVLDWDGDGWERHCLGLLRMRYKEPGQFERIPSSDHGDLGIEGFSHDGCAYQCYAPDGPLPIKDRYEKQRDKLTADISKLINNGPDLEAILGGVTIQTYVFMTPVHNSRRLNQHAKTKAAEVRAKSLRHCSPNFDIVIHTEEDYAAERQELLNLGLHKLQLDPLPVPEAAVQSYVASNPDLIATIDGKLSRLPGLAPMPLSLS